MLRKRSRTVTTSKQTTVADPRNIPWLPPEKSKKPTSFFLNSPKIFKGFFTKNSSSSDETEPIMSPTSILDPKPFFNKIPTTIRTKTISENKHSWEQQTITKGIGLALIDDNSELSNKNNNSTSPKQQQQQKRKLVVFGSQLKIQVPPLQNSSVFPCFSTESPGEFGIKTPRSNLWTFCNQIYPEEKPSTENGILTESVVSMSEIEQSEDYTCVISHGPNPKTTHIFGNCIVESCCGVVGSSSFSSRRNGYFSSLGNSVPSPDNFLSFCHRCKKQLGQGKDIFMYRGEKAFCSQECRCQEMLFDGVEN